MDAIKNFDELIAFLERRGDRKRIAVVWGSDSSTQHAVTKALEHGFVEAIFVGCRAEVMANERLMAHVRHINFVDTDDKDEAARLAVELIREGKADILMKGMINTDNLLKAVINKQTGILPQGKVLTHVAAAFIPGYPKMLCFTDAAVIPYPTQQQRIAQVNYMAYVCHALGIEEPRIALCHCDGPMDVKCACSTENMLKKGIESPVNGQADALIFPDIEAGNSFYKTITLFCNADTAAILQGALCPVVLPSRADSSMSKYYSLALAVL